MNEGISDCNQAAQNQSHVTTQLAERQQPKNPSKQSVIKQTPGNDVDVIALYLQLSGTYVHAQNGQVQAIVRVAASSTGRGKGGGIETLGAPAQGGRPCLVGQDSGVASRREGRHRGEDRAGVYAASAGGPGRSGRVYKRGTGFREGVLQSRREDYRRSTHKKWSTWQQYANVIRPRASFS